MVCQVIVIDEKQLRLVNAKIWNNKQLWQIYNELLNLKTKEHAGKSVAGAWHPIGILESVCVGGAKVKFDIVALK